MKKYYQLSYILASIYLVTATIILYRWATGISPILEGGWFIQEDGHNLAESLILLLPLLPAYIIGICIGPLLEANTIIISDTLVFVELLSTIFFISLVIINTISWFFIGRFIQILIDKISSLLVTKDSKKKARSKV